MERRQSMITMSIRYPVDVHDKLRELAGEADRPIAYLIRKAIDEYLERIESDHE